MKQNECTFSFYVLTMISQLGEIRMLKTTTALFSISFQLQNVS